jgi:SAM-dependent methyltransferase
MESLSDSSVPPVALTRPHGFDGARLSELVGELHARLTGPIGRPEIRLLQSLDEALEQRLADAENRFSQAYLQELLGTYAFWQRDVAPTWDGASVLELGAGSENPLAIPFAMYLLGAARAHSLDVSDLLSERQQARALARTLFWLSRRPETFGKLAGLAALAPRIRERAAGIDAVSLAAGELSLPEQVSHVRASAEATGLESASFDRVCSSSFLEHVGSPADCIAEIARITAPGGIGIHNLDLADHGRYWGAVDSPVRFLTEAGSASSVRTCNRWRLHQFLQCFAEHGFEPCKVVVYEQHAWTAEELAARVAPYSTMTEAELRPLQAVVVVRRR